MKDWLQRIKRFFLPPEGAPTWVRLIPYLVLGGLTLLLLTGGAYAWEYTNSPEFCGTSCHTMPPEYTAYLTSPHARIDCVDCHIGKGFIATRITRKAGDIKHVIATTFKTYEYPIRAGDLRPARETCELCHFPEKFSDDSLRELKSYQNDVPNTPKTTYLVLKTGGGSERLGLGRGIHWHILNKVDYLATDDFEQEIPYVRVTEDDGSITEYVDITTDFDPNSVKEEDLEEMDCITCHNRISHLISNPEDTVDQLLARGQISAEIPEIRRQAVGVYDRLYDDVNLGLESIAGMAGYYQKYYPDYYAAEKGKIDEAIRVLQDAYQASVFPTQKADWTAHPTNVGHKDSPGCFRCHDGNHMNTQNEAIRLECNLCHSIPVVAGPEDYVADLEISRGPEPESHRNPNWISLHHNVYDATCANCHTTENAGGTDNTSFCSNSACHGNVWEYAGFDAPALREILSQQIPPTPTPAPIQTDADLTYAGVIGPLFQSRCGSCHGQGGLKNLNLTTYESALAGGDSGPAVVPGEPEASRLVQVQSGPSPHFSQLAPQELDVVIQWIEAGAPQ